MYLNNPKQVPIVFVEINTDLIILTDSCLQLVDLSLEAVDGA